MSPMFTHRPDFLRQVLFADSATCAACGLFMVAAARPFASLSQIPPELLRYAGLALFPIAVFIALVAARGARSLPAVGAVIAGNLAWIAASLWLMTSGIISPTTLGVVFLG